MRGSGLDSTGWLPGICTLVLRVSWSASYAERVNKEDDIWKRVLFFSMTGMTQVRELGENGLRASSKFWSRDGEGVAGI